MISTGAPSRGVAGSPLLPALAEEPILSCHVPQLSAEGEEGEDQQLTRRSIDRENAHRLPPWMNPVFQSV